MSSTLAYKKKWLMDVEQGRYRMVPAAPVIHHIRVLHAAGWTYRAIAEQAGVSVTYVCDLIRGNRNATQRSKAARVLTIRPETIYTRANHDGFVPNLGTRRRIAALLAIGWTHDDITRTAGLPARRSATILHQVGNLVTRATHDAIAGAYDALSMRPGPSEHTRLRARRRGYAPPLAWDDDQLDDPTAKPTGVRTDEREPAVIAVNDWAELVHAGTHPETAAKQVGVSLQTLAMRARRAGHPATTTLTSAEKRQRNAA